jgi:hypothetical protein
MAKPIRVGLVNDYEIVLEGLRAFFGPYEPEILVVEMKAKAKPQRAVDVLFESQPMQLRTSRASSKSSDTRQRLAAARISRRLLYG